MSRGSLLRRLAKLVPGELRRNTLEVIKREYRLGEPSLLTRHPECYLDLLDLTLAHYARLKSSIQFLQIGACDGVLGDPIHPLLKKYGLRGTLVEPRREAFEKLKLNYLPFGSGFTFVNAAIGSRDGCLPIYSLRQEATSPDWYYGTASFDKNLLLMNLRAVPDPESHIQTESVRVLTFSSLLEEYNVDLHGIDLLQIDAEGFDAEILRLFDFASHRPAIVRFEHMHLSPRDYESAIASLLGHGYALATSLHDTLAYRPASAGTTAPATPRGA